MKYCTSCGSALAPGLTFCTSCGQQVAAADESATTVVAPAAAPWVEERPREPATAPVAGPAAPRAGAPVDAAPTGGRGPWRAPLLGVAAVGLVAAVGVGSYLLFDSLSADDTATQRTARGASSTDRVAESSSADPTPEASASAPAEPSTAPTPTVVPPPPPPPQPSGPLVPVGVQADCQAPPALDSLRNTVTYEPELTTDADPSTAWRCPGSAVGRQLVYDFGRPVTLTEVALVPGYDKVDPADGIDRFTENRTVSGVVWHLDGGRTYRQDIARPNRVLTPLALPGPVTTRSVVLEIVSTGNDGARRDFTPISEVAFTGY